MEGHRCGSGSKSMGPSIPGPRVGSKAVSLVPYSGVVSILLVHAYVCSANQDQVEMSSRMDPCMGKVQVRGECR